MNVDIHAHFTPSEWTEAIRRDGEPFGSRVEQDGSGRLWLRFGDGSPAELLPELSDLDTRLQAMQQRGLDRQVLLPPMTVVGYQLDEHHGRALSRLFNETNADVARRSDGRLIPVATVPMQSSRAAVEELDYAVKQLDIPMVEIGTNIEGANLDDEAFRPFFARAAQLDVLVLLHPHQIAGADRLRRYYLSNLIGNPMDTTIAAASLIFGGVLEQHPSLKICLVHGGGALPYLLGRASHGYAAVASVRTTPVPPIEYVRRLYFDTLVHDPRALSLLHDLVGPDHLLIGTDYPYDMGEDDPLGELKRAGLDQSEPILGGNAARLLRLAD